MRKEKRQKASYMDQFRHLRDYLILAGIKLKVNQVYTILFVLCAIIDVSLLFYFIFRIIEYDLTLLYVVIVSFVMLTLGYILIFFLIWLVFLFFLDYLKFKRRTALEEVLPEFLRLVSANHRAGLPLDVSLWKANRPRFGILSEEINQVARNTYASGELVSPLREFGSKYDSSLLRRAISNIVEGLKTGSDLAGLLDDISNNITTIQNTRKELASEVENYMLFITITVLIISPLMFALAQKMSDLIEGVKSSLTGSMSEDSAMQMPIQLEISKSERKFTYYFDIFVYLMIATNSIISVLLMSLVKYGNVQRDLKKVPIYFLVGIFVYFVCKSFFANFLVF